MKKSLKPLLFIGFLLLFSGSINGQCYSDYLHQEQLKTNIHYDLKNQKLEGNYQQYVLEDQKSFKMANYTIPVVFHLVHSSSSTLREGANLELDQIQNLLDKLNSALDGNTICPSDPNGINTQINFCLASRTISNQPTSGYTKWESNELSILDPCEEGGAIKNIARQSDDDFPSTDYLNIWVVEDICPSCYGSCALAAYSTYPAAHGTIQDGIVTESRIFQDNDCDQLKILMHEIGHYFNLLHTFNAACQNNDCLIDGDKVCDTPPDNDANFYPDHPCRSTGTVNSCNTDVNASDANNPFISDQADLSNNFMDYAPLSCINSFTLGQMDRMYAAIEGPRMSLLGSKGCFAPCPSPITVLLESPDTAYIGEPFAIINNSTGATSFEWTVDGNTFYTQDLNYIFNAEGKCRIIISAENDNANCKEQVILELLVLCRINTAFTFSPEVFSAGDIITLTPDVSFTNDLSFSWYNGNTLISQDYQFTFPASNASETLIHLETCSNLCCKRESKYLFNSEECKPKDPVQYWFIASNNQLNFDSTPPVMSQERVLQASYPYREIIENVSIAGDSEGKLIIYTNGQDVLNKNREIMPNGKEVRGFGSTSISQTIILNHPSEKNIYYLLCSAEGNRTPTSSDLDYVKVDMNLDGGLGDVIGGRVLLVEQTNEMVTAIRHCNGMDYWVVTQLWGGDTLAVVLLDQDGFHAPSYYPTGLGRPGNGWGAGGIKANPQGTFIAISNTLTVRNNIIGLQFNNATGEIFGGFKLIDKLYRGFKNLGFSPDGTKLYTPSIEISSSISKFIYQFDLSVMNPDSIINSRVSIRMNGTQNVAYPRSFQMAANGKLYVTNAAEISIIHEPNKKGPACDFEYKVYNFTGSNFYQSLPFFPNDYFFQPKEKIRIEDRLISGVDTICLGDTTVLNHNDLCDRSFDWILPTESVLLSDEGERKELLWNKIGLFPVMLEQIRACDTLSDTLWVQVLDCLGECVPDFQWRNIDTIICAGETALLNLNSNANTIYFEGQKIDGDFIKEISPTSDQCYDLRLVSEQLCDTTIQICITVREALDLDIGDIHNICEGNDLILAINTDADRMDLINDSSGYIIPNISSGDIISTPQSDSCYSLRLQRNDGCDQYYNFCVTVHQNWQDTSYGAYCEGDISYFNGMPIMKDTFICANLLTKYGCDSLVCALYEFGAEERVDETISICTGDTIVLFGEMVTQAGEYNKTYSREGDCDSLHSIFVMEELTPSRTEDYDLCKGKELILYDKTITEEGKYSFEVESPVFCDSIINIDVNVFDTFYQEFIFELCQGDSIWVVDAYQSSPGNYSHSLVSDKGCDSTIITHLRAISDISGPSFEVNCEEALIIANQAVPENWSIVWSNGDTLEQSIYKDGGAEEQLLLIRHSSSGTSDCEQEIVFTLPNLPDGSAVNNILQDTQAILGELITLSLPIDGYNWSIQWSANNSDNAFSCDTCFTTMVTLNTSTTISYTLTHEESGCIFNYEFTLKLIEQKDLFLPSAFSPNEDGNNDFWEVFASSRVDQVLECSIYGRWGNELAHWENTMNIKWDGKHEGKALNPAVFVYIIKYSLKTGEEYIITGDFTLVK